MPLYLGIDLGAHAVKVAALRVAYRKTTLERLVSVALPPIAPLGADGTAEGPRDTQEAQKIALIAAVTEASGGKLGKADGLAVAVPGTKVATRRMKLPSSVQKQIAEVLPFELESQVPFDLEECVWDYRILQGGRLPGDGADELAMLVAVAPRALIAARIAAVRDAVTQEPERVSLGAFPLANLVAASPRSAEVFAVLDLGVVGSELLIFQGNELAFSRSMDCGTKGLPQSASRLARELRTSLAAFRAQGGTAPARLFLAGGGVFVAGAESFLARELEMPVAALPEAPLDVAPTVTAEQRAQFPVFAKAIGSALSLVGKPADLDLRRGPLAFERGFGWLSERLPVLSGLVGILGLAFLLSSSVQLLATYKERDALEAALGTVSKDVLGEETTSPDRVTELLGKQTGAGDTDPLPHIDGFDVLVRFAEVVPSSVKHDIESVDLAKGHVRLSGMVPTVSDAQAIAKNLADAEPCFQNVKVTGTNQVVGQDRQKYVMEFELRCPEDVKKDAKKKADTAKDSAKDSGKETEK